MHNSNTLQVTGYELPPVSPKAFGAFFCTPGKVVVEMSGQIERIGSIYIPTKVSGKLRCDVGIVVACQPPRNKRGEALPMDIKPGDAVLVRPYDGAWFDGFDTGKYQTENQVRFYGIAGTPGLKPEDRGVYETVPWNDSIVARLVGNVVIPTHGNVLLAIDSGKHEFLALPDGTSLPTQTATVAAPGSTGYSRGQRVVWIPSHEDLHIELGEELRLVKASQIEAVI
jgi:co-chaperonin GroES (HSP10)